MVLVQLVLGSHVLRLLRHLVQEVASLALRKVRVKLACKRVYLVISLHLLPHEPVCSTKDRRDKKVRVD